MISLSRPNWTSQTKAEGFKVFLQSSLIWASPFLLGVLYWWVCHHITSHRWAPYKTIVNMVFPMIKGRQHCWSILDIAWLRHIEVWNPACANSDILQKRNNWLRKNCISWEKAPTLSTSWSLVLSRDPWGRSKLCVRFAPELWGLILPPKLAGRQAGVGYDSTGDLPWT